MSLKDFKFEISKKLWDENHPTEQQAVRQGFDVCLSLDLPIKFSEWKYISTTMIGNDFYSAGEYLCTFDGSMKGLYQYWIDNVLNLSKIT